MRRRVVRSLRARQHCCSVEGVMVNAGVPQCRHNSGWTSWEDWRGLFDHQTWAAWWALTSNYSVIHIWNPLKTTNKRSNLFTHLYKNKMLDHQLQVDLIKKSCRVKLKPPQSCRKCHLLCAKPDVPKMVDHPPYRRRVNKPLFYSTCTLRVCCRIE